MFFGILCDNGSGVFFDSQRMDNLYTDCNSKKVLDRIMIGISSVDLVQSGSEPSWFRLEEIFPKRVEKKVITLEKLDPCSRQLIKDTLDSIPAEGLREIAVIRCEFVGGTTTSLAYGFPTEPVIVVSKEYRINNLLDVLKNSLVK